MNPTAHYAQSIGQRYDNGNTQEKNLYNNLGTRLPRLKSWHLMHLDCDDYCNIQQLQPEFLKNPFRNISDYHHHR